VTVHFSNRQGGGNTSLPLAEGRLPARQSPGLQAMAGGGGSKNKKPAFVFA